MFEPCLLDYSRYYDERGFISDLTDIFTGELDSLGFCPRQILVSSSAKWVIRGMHSQVNYPQRKLINVLDGKILDVVVNIDISSGKYGEVTYFPMDASNNQSLFIPHGYLHGFQVLSENAKICYIIDGCFVPNDALSVTPLDPTLNIKWKKSPEIIMSNKDREGLYFDKVRDKLEQ